MTSTADTAPGPLTTTTLSLHQQPHHFYMAESTVPIVFKLETASRTLTRKMSYWLYHGKLLYEAVVMDVRHDEKLSVVYDLRYQGCAHVISKVVFEHDDNNHIIAHQLLRSAKARQQVIGPASSGNVPARLEYEARNEARSVGANSLHRPVEPDANQHIEKYSSASPEKKKKILVGVFREWCHGPEPFHMMVCYVVNEITRNNTWYIRYDECSGEL